MIRKQDTILRVAEPTQLMDFLIAKMGGMARSSVKQLLGQRRVKVGNAIQTRHDFVLKQGDVVTVSSGRGNSQLTHPKLRIVYEDDDLIVVNKQPGLLTVAATPGSSETTAYSILRAYVRKQNARAGIYVVHRLDRETSGLLVFARSQELQQYMRTYWRDLVKERTYIALAEGVLEPCEGKITTWLTEDKRNAVVYSSPVDDGGDIAITNYKTLRTSADGEYSLVELHLETGRSVASSTKPPSFFRTSSISRTPPVPSVLVSTGLPPFSASQRVPFSETAKWTCSPSGVSFSRKCADK